MFIIEPDSQHHCRNFLPDANGKKHDTLAMCPVIGCRRWWRKYTDYSTWADETWAPVRWFHFNLRRRIKREVKQGGYI